MHKVLADTSLYKSAGWVGTDGSPAYSNINGCQVSNDNLYCSRPNAASYADLYLSSFGNLESFNIPKNSQITKIHIRIKGKSSVPLFIGLMKGKNLQTAISSCQVHSDLWNVNLGTIDREYEFHSFTLGNGLSDCVTAANIDQEKLTFNIRYSGSSNWSADIDNFEIAFDYNPPGYPWARKDDLNISRFFHSATLLNDGSVLVVGGEDSGLGVRQTEIYNPLLNTWVIASSANYGRRYHTANLISSVSSIENSKVLIAGGHENPGAGYLDSAEIYSPDTNKWTLTSSMNSKRAFHSSSVLNDGTIMITGGSNGLDILNSSEIYDIYNNKWIPSAPFNTARRDHKQISFIDDQGKYKVMIIGGIDKDGKNLKSTEIYDPENNNWSIGQDMNYSHSDFSAAVLHDGRILVAGTDYPNDQISEIYDPKTKLWVTYSMSNPFRHSGALALLGEKGKFNVLAAGGNTSSTNSAQLFDPLLNKWESIEPMNAPRGRFTLTTLKDGSVLAASGLGSGVGNTNTSEVYNPPEVLGISTAPTPTAAPTPVPTQTVQPFLDLPWDYQGKGQSFSDSALAINTYFDHEYPLLGRSISLHEPDSALGSIMPFMGSPRRFKPDFYYSSHDGYDYGTDADVHVGDPVIPAASGSATYEYDSAGGNTILVDHHNGYQTRYYHLQNGLIKAPREVDRSTIIGHVGSTGTNTSGPHIHIGVFQDKNGDGKFEDNEPDGATDPFGWMPFTDSSEKEPDPWENYQYFYNGQESTGNKSNYLWKNTIPGIKQTLTSNGQTVNIENDTITFDPDSSLAGLKMDAHLEPTVKISNLLKSIGPALSITLKDAANKLIAQLNKPILRISISFSDGDLYRFRPDSLAIYSSSDMSSWKKEDSVIDIVDKKVTITIDHLTSFALMGERVDTVAPSTTADLQGEKGQNEWYRSDVLFKLIPMDNEDGLGIENTQYKVEGEDWTTYTSPINFTSERDYKVSFYSVDKDNNIEDVHSEVFHIDKTAPVTTADTDGTEGANGWYTSDVSLTLTAQDSGSGIDKTEYSTDNGTTFNQYSEDIHIKTEGTNNILYRSFDKAGNVESTKNLTIKIDKTPPSSVLYVTGNKGQDSWYRTNVEIALNGTDSHSGYKTSYYSLNGDNYTEYINPIILENEGEYKIFYYTVDMAGNVEDKRTFVFNIDKTPPVVSITASPSSIWPPTGKLMDVKVSGYVKEDNLSTKPAFKVVDEYGSIMPILTGFNQTIKLEASRNGNDMDGRIYTISVNAEDLAGNTAEAEQKVIVPHDQVK